MMHSLYIYTLCLSTLVCSVVECVVDMQLWRSKFSAFIFISQIQYCSKLIVVPLSVFHRMAESIGDPRCELLFLFNTGRCGSTLMVKVMINFLIVQFEVYFNFRLLQFLRTAISRLFHWNWANTLLIEQFSNWNESFVCSGGFRGGQGAMPPKRIMVSASDVAVDKRLYVSRQSESVVKSAHVSVTTDRTLDCIARTLNYVF